MAVTIRSAVGDVGVSPATVSLALNNSDMVSANTARRVKEAAERMGYVHNVFARSLAKGARRLTLLSAPRAQHAGYALRRLPQRCSPDWMTGSSPALRPCPLPTISQPARHGQRRDRRCAARHRRRAAGNEHKRGTPAGNATLHGIIDRLEGIL